MLPARARLAALGEALNAAATLEEVEQLAPFLWQMVTSVPSRPSVVRWLSEKMGWRDRADPHELSGTALGYLICQWEAIPGAMQTQMAAIDSAAIRSGLNIACKAGTVDGRVQAAVSIGAIGRPNLAPALAELLKDGDKRVQSAAEQSLFGLVLRASAVSARAEVDDANMDSVAGVVAAAIEGGRGDARGLVTCALVMAEASVMREARADPLRLPGVNALAKLLFDPRSAHAALVASTLRWMKLPVATGRCVEWLATAPYARVSAERLRDTRGVLGHAEVLGKWHLLLRPVRMGALGRMAAGKRRVSGTGGLGLLQASPTGSGESIKVRVPERGLLPTPGEYRNLNSFERRGVASLAVCTGSSAPLRAAAIEPLLVDACPLVRYSAVMAAPKPSLLDWCFDSHPMIARSATLRYLDGRRERSGGHAVDAANVFLTGLARSPVAMVSHLASMELESGAGATVNSAMGDRWIEQARRSLRGEGLRDARACMIVLEQIRKGHAQRRFTEDLLHLIGTTHHSHLVATAISLLASATLSQVGRARRAGEVGGAMETSGAMGVVRAVGEQLRHADSRVVANAVDACVKFRRQGIELPGELDAAIIELKDHPHHRVRGGALRAELLVGGRPGQSDPIRKLLGMLRDPRPGHRLAGAWLAGRVADLSQRLGDCRGVIHELTHLATSVHFEQLAARAGASLARWRSAAGALVETGAGETLDVHERLEAIDAVSPTTANEEPPRLRLVGVEPMDAHDQQEAA